MKDMEFRKEYYTIDEVCKMYDIEVPSHIKTNEKLSRVNDAQFDIIRNSTHDGTLLFTRELLGRAIENLVNKESFYKGDNMEGVTDIEYEIGLISLSTVFGTVDLPVGRYPGEKQRVRIPVKCKLIRNVC
jgi:hypothetical protein